MTRLTLLTRPGCHLCDEMKSVIDTLPTEFRMAVEQIDITGQTTLEHKFGTEIPVLLVDERVIAKIRTTTELLLEQLQSINQKMQNGRMQ